MTDTRIWFWTVVAKMFLSEPSFGCPNLTGKYLFYGDDDRSILEIKQENCEEIDLIEKWGYFDAQVLDKIVTQLSCKIDAVTRPFEGRYSGADGYRGRKLTSTCRFKGERFQWSIRVQGPIMTGHWQSITKEFYLDKKGDMHQRTKFYDSAGKQVNPDGEMIGERQKEP